MTSASPKGIPTWPTNPYETILGDAIHLMAPAMGTGTNTALKDVELLRGLLQKHGGWMEGIVERYEETRCADMLE